MKSYDTLLNAGDVAGLLGITRFRVYELVRRQLIPCVRLGRSVRFSRAALDRFIEAGGTAHSSDADRITERSSR